MTVTPPSRMDENTSLHERQLAEFLNENVEPPTDKPKSIEAALANVLNLHFKEIDGVKAKAREIGRRYSLTKQERSQLQEQLKQANEKYEKIQEENTKLNNELEKCKNSVCKQCEIYIKQTSTSDALYKNLLQTKDEEISRLRKQVEGLKRSLKDRKKTYTDTEIDLDLQTQSEVVQEQKQRTARKNQPNCDDDEPRTADWRRTPSKEAAKNAAKTISEKDSSWTTKNQEDHMTSDDHVTSDGHVTDDHVTGGNVTSDDTSPANARARGLKLVRKSKRCRYSAETIPKRKRSCVSENSDEEQIKCPGKKEPKLPRRATFVGCNSTTNNNKNTDLHVLAAETCDLNATDLDKSQRSRSRLNRPNIIIPETVQPDLLCSSEDEVTVQPSMSETSTSIDPDETCLPNMETCHESFRPRSPANRPRSPTNIPLSNEYRSRLSGVRTLRQRSTCRTPTRARSKVLSSDEDGSPNINGDCPRSKGHSPQSSKGQTLAQRSLTSPSLFDEDGDHDDSVIASPRKLAVHTGHRKPRKRNLSVQSESTPSPSVLSGKIPGLGNAKAKEMQGQDSPISYKLRSALNHQERAAEDSGSPDLTKNGKRLVQTKLSNDLFMPKKIHLPNIPEYNGGTLTPSKNRELRDIEEALRRSLEDQEMEKNVNVARGHQETNIKGNESLSISSFTGPQMASTQAETELEKEAGQTFKKPQIPARNPMTPKQKRKNILTESSPRRSPRLNRINRNIESVESDTLPDLDIVGQGPESPLRSKSRRTLNMNEGTNKDSLENDDLINNKLNGSIDPVVRLSQYDSADNEPVEIIHGAQPSASLTSLNSAPTEGSQRLTRSQRSLSRSQRPKVNKVTESLPESDDLDLTCQSVVFAAGKKNTDPNSRSIRHTKSKSSEGVEKSANNIAELQENVIILDNVLILNEDMVDSCQNILAPEVYKEPLKMRGSNPRTEAGKKNDGAFENSFDVAPKSKEPGYKYAEVVRNRAERENLRTFTCKECEDYFNAGDLTEEEREERLRYCRHRARYVPPPTPENFWEMRFPDTQEAQERGYFRITQGKPSKYRRKRKLNKLFKSKEEEQEDEQEDVQENEQEKDEMGDISDILV